MRTGCIFGVYFGQRCSCTKMQSIHLRRGLLEQASPVVMVVTSPVDPLCCPIVSVPGPLPPTMSIPTHLLTLIPARFRIAVTSPNKVRDHIAIAGRRGGCWACLLKLLGLGAAVPLTGLTLAKISVGEIICVCIRRPCRCPYRTNDASQGCGVRCTVPMRRVNDSRLSSRRTGLPPAARQPVCRASRRAK